MAWAHAPPSRSCRLGGCCARRGHPPLERLRRGTPPQEAGVGAWGQGRLQLMARQLPGPVCPLAPHGTESGRTGTLIGPADTAASGPLPGLHQKPQGPGETGPRCARRLRPSCEAAVPPPRARSRCPGRAKLVSVKNPKDMGLATRNWARLHSAEGASPPHSHQTARPRAPAVPTRRRASRRRAEVGPMGTTRSRGSGPCMHRHVCACVRACVPVMCAGPRALARAVRPELNGADAEGGGPRSEWPGRGPCGSSGPAHRHQ